MLITVSHCKCSGRSHTSRMDRFVDAIARELEKPRPLLKQVADYITSRYMVARDGMGEFLESEVEKLEEVDLDLLFSPQFTPTIEDQAAFSDLLDGGTVSSDQWPEIIIRLERRPTTARLVTEDENVHKVVLRDVSIERFVNRLNLDRGISDQLAKVIDSLAPTENRRALKAIARRPIFKDGGKGEILFQYLVKSTADDFFTLTDALELLRILETYRPSDSADLLERIPKLLEVLELEVSAAGQPKPFFADRVQELHGGGRDQRKQDNSMVGRKKAEFALLIRLQSVLAG